MAMPKADTRIAIDRSKSIGEEPDKGHNRWHPDIPPIASVRQGQVVCIEARDVFDAQLSASSTVEDVLAIEFDKLQPLTGPVFVEGAKPGDILEIDILDVEPGFFGCTVQMSLFGFLRDIYKDPYLIRWRLSDGFATSDDLPGVRIPGAPFMGVMGNAPSLELLERIAQREAELAARGGAVALPNANEAVPAHPDIAGTGLITLPPREFGGNVDIKQLTRGTTVRLPVYVPGALFSTGDAHYAQGDNECCTAIEMASALYCSFRVVEGEAAALGINDIQFYRDEPAPTMPRRYFATTGQSRTREGVNHSEDATLAARNALLNMIDHLVDVRGYTPQQAYAICSVAVDLKMSQLADFPNFLVSAFLPLDIFTE